jgi:hypothetical protein
MEREGIAGATVMGEQQTNQPKRNWMAIWWFFVISLCGATIAAHSMGRRAIEMLSEAADRPDVQEHVALIREQFDMALNVANFASIAVLLVSAFLIPKFYGSMRKK